MDVKEIFVTRSSMPSYEEYCEAIKPLGSHDGLLTWANIIRPWKKSWQSIWTFPEYPLWSMVI